MELNLKTSRALKGRMEVILSLVRGGNWMMMMVGVNGLLLGRNNNRLYLGELVKLFAFGYLGCMSCT